MLRKLKKLLSPSNERAEDKPTLIMACSALLLELAQIDGEETQSEQTQLVIALQQLYQVSSEQAAETIIHARQLLDTSVDSYAFTSILRDQCSVAERQKIMQQLWMIAYADQFLDMHEEARLRKCADLLGLSHSEYLQAKHSAK